MLRKHATLLITTLLIVLVATACLVRTAPRRGDGNSYRTAPSGDHGKHKDRDHDHDDDDHGHGHGKHKGH